MTGYYTLNIFEIEMACAERGITEGTLLKKANCSINLLSRLRSNPNTRTNTKTAGKMAHALNVPVARILKWTNGR